MGCNNCSSVGLPKGCKNNGACSTGECNGKLTVFDWLTNITSNATDKTQYVEVRFKNDHKDFFINNSNLPLVIGDIVAVEGNPGHDIGVISLTGELVKIQIKKKKPKSDELRKIYRKANAKDIDVWQDFKNKESEVMIEARRIARGLGIQMKICDVEYQGDGSKVTLYYTAEGRIDFRQLIKDFARSFHAKIDMRQIGYRQESAKVGGIGSCGRELCCSSWLTDFRSVNTAAARYQQLSINPQKLAGQCGKLKCCLNYELDLYVDALSDFPSNQTVLETEKGRAHCIKVDVLRKQMWFTYVDNSITWFPIEVEEVKQFIKENKTGKKIKPLEEINEQELTPLSGLKQEEDSLNRFENKPKNKKKKNKSKNAQTVNQENNQPVPKTNNAKELKKTQNHKNKDNRPRSNKQDSVNNSGKNPRKIIVSKKTNNNNQDNSKS